MLTLPEKPKLLSSTPHPQKPKEPQTSMYHGELRQAQAQAETWTKYAAALEKYEKEKKEIEYHNSGISQKNYEIWSNWFDNLPKNPLMEKIMELVVDRYDRNEWTSAYIYIEELIELCNFAQKQK